VNLTFWLLFGAVLVAAEVVTWRVLTRGRRGTVRGLPCDGKPLTQPEQERFLWVTQGYGRTASEQGRRR
jgi:hypothetical protein